ncbi:MAG: ABC transporter ATP-binding protein [Fimbriimonadales bacterium]
MSSLLRDALTQAIPPDERDSIALALESDVLRSGQFGEVWLIATHSHLYCVEPLEGMLKIGDQARVIASWSLLGLTEFRYEELVDAGCLVAKMGSQDTELIRGSTSHAPQIAAIAKKLNRLRDSDVVDPHLESKRICPKCHRPLPKDSDICEGCLNRGRTLRRMFGYLKPYKMHVALSSLMLVALTLVEFAPSLLLKYLIDDVLPSRKLTIGFTWVCVGLLGSYALSSLLNSGRLWLNAYLGNRVTVDIRAKLFAHLQALSLGFYDRRTVGSTMSRMTNDTGALYEVLVDGIPMILRDGLKLVGIPIVLLFLDWKVALWTLAPVPVVIWLVHKFRTRIMRVWRRFWHSWSRLSGALNGVLSGMRVVKAFHGEAREVDRFGRRIQELADTGYAAEGAWATFFPMITFCVSVGTALAWFVGGVAVIKGEMLVGTFVAFLTLLTMLQGPQQTLTRLIDWTSRALTAAERVFEVLDTVPDIQQPRSPQTLDEFKAEVTFHQVHFGYDKAHEVLHGIQLHVKPGEMIGIVGPSGSGKTTLMSLLMRFYDPTEGRIEIDGVDIRDLDLYQFRERVGVVPQESYLFPGSIGYNIAYGRPDATKEEIIAAAKAANAHGFITRFADGYDTYVGERGQRLSGGERQRISIARAILHNPKLLVLDEATSSVDTETERMIQEALQNLVSGRTVFAIAHRLSTLRNADRIIVLEEGKMTEVGTHDELMVQEGTYHKLVTMQQEIAKTRSEFIGVEEEEVEASS